MAIPVSIAYRFAISAAVMFAVLLLTRRLRRLAPRDHLFCVLQGCCVFGFDFFCFYHAAAYISSGLESVIFSMAVLFNALNSLLFFRQRPSPNLLPAALLGLTGIVALFWQDLAATRMAPELLKGIGLSALGTYGFSLGNMISTRHQRRGLDIFSTNTYAMTYGALLMALIALAQGASFQMEHSSRYIGSLLYGDFRIGDRLRRLLQPARPHRRRRGGLQHPAVPAGGADHLNDLRRLSVALQRRAGPVPDPAGQPGDVRQAGAEMATGGYLKTKLNPLKPLANIVIIRFC